VVGLKPTYGRVSTRGVIPLSPSYDHVGPITNSVYDAALMMQVMTDQGSPAECDEPSFISAFDEFPSHVRIGVPRAFFFDDLHAEVANATEKAIGFSANSRPRFVTSRWKCRPTALLPARKP